MGLLFREHPKAQPEGGFRRSPGSNLRPLVYKVSDLTTASFSRKQEHLNLFTRFVYIPQGINKTQFRPKY